MPPTIARACAMLACSPPSPSIPATARAPPRAHAALQRNHPCVTHARRADLCVGRDVQRLLLGDRRDGTPGGHAAPLGPLAGRDARSCAHHRDGIPAFVTMSSPSTGAGCGAAPLIARCQPRSWARYAPSLWSSRRGAASRPASRGMWWSAARHDEPVLAAQRPAGGHQGWPAAGAPRRRGKAPGGAGGDGRGRWHRPCALPLLPHGSRGDAPLHAHGPSSWHALCSLSMRRKAS